MQHLFTPKSVTYQNEIYFNTFYLISYLLQHLVLHSAVTIISHLFQSMSYAITFGLLP